MFWQSKTNPVHWSQKNHVKYDNSSHKELAQLFFLLRTCFHLNYHENSLYLAFMHIKTWLSSLFILYRFLILHFTNFRHLCVKVFSLLWNSWINDYISIGNLDFQGLIPLYYTANVVNKLPFHYKYHYLNSMYIKFTENHSPKKKILHVFDGS